MADIYKIDFAASAEKQFGDLQKPDRKRVAKKIDALQHDPRPPYSKKLKGVSDLYRVRAGDFRIVYQVRDRVITVLIVRIGHRGDVYERL